MWVRQCNLSCLNVTPPPFSARQEFTTIQQHKYRKIFKCFSHYPLSTFDESCRLLSELLFFLFQATFWRIDLNPMLGSEVPHSADNEQVGGIACSYQTSSVYDIVHCAKPSLTVSIALWQSVNCHKQLVEFIRNTSSTTWLVFNKTKMNFLERQNERQNSLSTYFASEGKIALGDILLQETK